jgi:hypothetical protein
MTVNKTPTRRRSPAGGACTQQEEEYAVRRAAGASAKEAFLGAYTWTGTERGAAKDACKVDARPRVQARIKELRDGYATRLIEASRGVVTPTDIPAYTAREAMAELDEAMRVAREKENAASMAKVVEIRMKLYGLGIGDAKNPADKEEMSPEALEAALADVRAARAAQVVPLKAVK